MPRYMWIGVVLAAAVVAILAVQLLIAPLFQTCTYWHPQLLNPGETAAPTPSGIDPGGYYCVPPD